MSIVPDTTWLLGAGASKDAGVPLASEMYEIFRGASGREELNATYDFVAAGVRMRTARMHVRGGGPSANIEDVANALDALIARDSSDIGPFVAAYLDWLTDMDPRGRPTRVAQERVAAVLQRLATNNPPSSAMDFSATAAELISAIHEPLRPGNILVELRQWLSRAVKDKVSPPYADCSYLKPLARTRIGTTDSCVGGTLNYDLCVETAFHGLRIDVCDGLPHWLSGDDMDGHTGVAHIFKPHGSIKWSATDEDTFARVEADDESLPGIIFGGRNKLTAHGPFLDSLLAWRSALEQCQNLILVGYSFGDDHVNALIASWFRREALAKRVFIVDPRFAPESSRIARLLHNKSNEQPHPPVDDGGGVTVNPPPVTIIRLPATTGVPEALDAAGS